MDRHTGDILHVDLTKQTWWRETVKKEDLIHYLSGRGISARILWDQVKPGTDPLGPENLLIFAAGLFSGTAAPSSGRTTVTCLSPATGLYMKTNAGGYWGGELKYAGYGHLVVHGRSDKPVYLFIDDERVEFRDATSLWGVDVRAADAAIKRELGDEDIQICAIGQAGENLVNFAAIMFSVYNAAGRCGAGAVMGAKHLKAVAVRGSGAVVPAKPDRFHQLALESREKLMAESGREGMWLYGTAGSLNWVNEMRVFAAYNFQRSSMDDVYPLTGQCLAAEGFLKRRVACFSCVIGCHRYATVEKGAYAGTYSGGPELETMGAFGTGCGILETETVMKANELCNIYGLDTISAGAVIQWAMESLEKGVLTVKDLDGEPLRWGDGAATIRMIKKIALREGFGNVLADGVRKAAQIVGGDSWKWAVEAKGLEQSRVDTRSAKSYALAFAVNPRGVDHLHTETFAEFGLSPESRDLIRQITGDEKFASPYLTAKRAEIVRWHEDCYAATDSLGFCAFSTTALYGITPKAMAALFSAFTGFEMTEAELMADGRRIVTLERCFNVRLGATRKEDTLPWRLMNEEAPDRPGAVNSGEELDEMLDRYYELHGWCLKTSRPTRESLLRLGLADVAEELAAGGFLGD